MSSEVERFKIEKLSFLCHYWTDFLFVKISPPEEIPHNIDDKNYA